MTRTEYLGKAWIAITDKLPPDTLDDVWIWLYNIKKAAICPSWLARQHAKDMEQGVGFPPGRMFDHWIKVAPPTKYQK